MLKKLALTVIFLTAFANCSEAFQFGNDRAEFSRRFSIMRSLCSYCRSNNENTSLSGLNKLREILFRGQENLSGIKISLSDTPIGLCERMNSDVDKIYTGLTNLENSLKLSDPSDQQDKYLNEILQYLIVSEIALILKDDFFLKGSEKTRRLVAEKRQAIFEKIQNNSTGDFKTTHAVDSLENILNLADYIYNEQVQWLMSTSFALQNLRISDFTISNESVFNGFKVNRPPRIYVINEDQLSLIDFSQQKP